MVLVEHDAHSRIATIEEFLRGFPTEPRPPDVGERIDELRKALRSARPRADLCRDTTQALPWVVRGYRVRAAKSQESSDRAEGLLLSLLDREQVETWRTTGRFAVPIPGGTIELGDLFNLRLRRDGAPDLALCVVPQDFATLPIEDVWTNLLLMLRTDPELFLGVANYRPYGSRGGYYRGPVPPTP